MSTLYTPPTSDLMAPVGAVFTPLAWGEFAVERLGIFEAWIKGASVFDPTMGNGQLLEALITFGLKQGYALDQLPTHRLYGNEIQGPFFEEAITRFQEKYALNMRPQWTQTDIMTLPERPYDIILGNPPWQNFVDLPPAYKEALKPAFTAYDLVDSPQSLLLGGSRIDLAALIVQRVMHGFLSPKGQAFFFLPLSLLLNDGAHQAFRRYQVRETSFALQQVWDLQYQDVFPSVHTRYGLVAFQRDQTTSFPIPYYRYEQAAWQSWTAAPLTHRNDPLLVRGSGETFDLTQFRPIPLPKAAKPRQGINTCGANRIFFFHSYQPLADGLCLVNDEYVLPAAFVHPLLVSQNFRSAHPKPQKWVLLPYLPTGKPLPPSHLSEYPHLAAYLQLHEAKLKARKGVLIQSWIKKGYWWAMMGVGPYNFAPYKIVWEAYGKHEFCPLLLPGFWQVNQALQAYIPLQEKSQAERVWSQLKQPTIESYLRSHKMEGTMNWAQPGRIKKLITWVD